MSEDEIYENQRLWAEENKSQMPGEEAVADDLGAVGGAPMPASDMPTSADDVSPDDDGQTSPIPGDQSADNTEV